MKHRALGMILAISCVVSLSACADTSGSRHPRQFGLGDGPIEFPAVQGLTMTPRKGEVFVSVALCASGAESVSIDDLVFSSGQGVGTKPRFLVNFAGPGPDAWGAGRIKHLTPNFVEPSVAKGEVLPCGKVGYTEVAVILPGNLPEGSYVDGFDLVYRSGAVSYSTHSVQKFGVCAVEGKHPKPLEEACITMKEP